MTAPPASLPGSYALLLFLPQDIRLAVGKLGTFAFPAGRYVYTGSAYGPGGISARLRHHLRCSSHPHWHIDYLRAAAQLLLVTIQPNMKLECIWAQRLASLGQIIVPGFGSSDCRSGCPAHLIYIGT